MHPEFALIVHAAKIQAELTKQRRERLLSAPPSEAVRLGIAAPQDGKTQAMFKVGELFDRVTAVADNGAVVALCSIFERMFVAKLQTAIGEARGNLRAHYQLGPFEPVRDGLIKDASHFQGLAPKLALVERVSSPEQAAVLGRIRVIRNAIVHGADIPRGRPLSVEEIATALNVALERLSIA